MTNALMVDVVRHDSATASQSATHAAMAAAISSPSGLEVAAAIAAWVALWLAVVESWRTISTISAFVIASSLLTVARPAGIVTVAVMLVAALLA
ncbi:MAG: hypothetical protein ACKOBR_00630, partial [Actinomycetota bacterium]